MRLEGEPDFFAGVQVEFVNRLARQAGMPQDAAGNAGDGARAFVFNRRDVPAQAVARR